MAARIRGTSPVHTLGGGNQRRVLPEQIPHQLHECVAVGGHRRQAHRRRLRRLPKMLATARACPTARPFGTAAVNHVKRAAAAAIARLPDPAASPPARP